MRYCKIGSIPIHRYVIVDTAFTHEKSIGWQEAMWVGITAIPGRAWGINVIFRLGGMMYRNIPPNAIAFDRSMQFAWNIDDAQAWNCYSYDFVTLQDPVLDGMRVSAKTKSGIHVGRYLFSTTHLNDGWSDAPDQDKMFIWCALDNGRMTIQPNNHVIFQDSSYVIDAQPIPKLILQETVYSVDERQNYRYDF
jgi:hypothetical protein